MAASGSQTIQLYYSTTSGTAPVAGNLASGELAINITDGKLYYKDNGGTVQTLATKDATSGSFSSITVSGSATLSGGTANGVLYLNGSKVATSGSALTFDGSRFFVGTTAVTTSSSQSGEIYSTGAAGFLFTNTTAANYPLSVKNEGTSGTRNLINFYEGTAGGNARANISLDGSNNFAITSANSTVFNASGSEQMRLTSTGLGIGTSSPSYKLTVQDTGNSYIVLQSATAGYANIRCIVTSSAGIIGTEGAFPFVFRTNDAERMRIDSSGNVGIGTSSPAGRLDAYGDGTNPAGVFRRGGAYGNIESSDAARSNRWTIGRDNSSTGNFVIAYNDSTKASIDSSGNLLVGTTSATPAQSNVSGFKVGSGQIECNGTNTQAAFFGRSNDGQVIRFYNAGTAAGNISNTGTTTSYNGTSDYRLKENIQPMVGALDKIAQLKPCTYTWKSDGRPGQGFIAHELQEVIPDAVQGTKDEVDENGNPEYQGIDPRMIVATLTAAIQEQQAIIENLKARLDAANL